MIRSSILILLTLFSCSEPIDFELGTNRIIVVDAQVAQTEGETYAIIYQNITTDQKVVKESISGLNVQLLSKAGEVVVLLETLADNDKRVYVPENNKFVGTLGQEYRLVVQSSDGYTITSDYDMLYEPVDFNLLIDQTTEITLGEANVSTEVNVFNAVAEVQPNREYYSKFSFRYQFDHYWYPGDDSTTINNDDFLLYSCNSEITCNEKQSFIVGSEIDKNWRFSESNCYDTINPFNVNTCPEWCCITLEDWDTKFYVRQEVLSAESFSYWKEVDQLLSNDGLVFDTPPFNIKGNLSCENCDFPVVGQFKSVSIIEKSTFVVL